MVYSGLALRIILNMDHLHLHLAVLITMTYQLPVTAETSSDGRPENYFLECFSSWPLLFFIAESVRKLSAFPKV